MPNSVLRVALAISALLAVLLMSSAGIAVAEPDESGSPPAPEPTGEPPVSEPQSTAPQPTTPTTQTPWAPDLPSAIAGALRDFFNRPLSIFGNGRVPGQAPAPVTVDPNGMTTVRDGARRDKPTAKPVPKPEPVPAPVAAEPVAQPTRPASSFNLALPFAPPVSIPLPPTAVPGYEGLRLTLDLTDPFKALSSLQETADTINSLLRDAYAPYDPVKPPAPKPRPTFKTQEEEPDVIDAGGAVTPVAQSSSDPPVLQAPPLLPPARVTLPLPVTGVSPGGVMPVPVPVPVAGNAAVGAPAARGPGSTLEGATPQAPAQVGPAPPNASAAALGRPGVRQGYQQYLRSARPPQVAAIAVPGLLGLLAITAGGVLTGYRQANSQRYLRGSEAARFLP